MKQAPVLNERERQRMLQHLQRTSYASPQSLHAAAELAGRHACWGNCGA